MIDALLRERWSSGTMRRRGCVYRGPHDFIAQHGERLTPRALPEGLSTGAPQMCFGNAIAIAVKFGLPYVEGYFRHPQVGARDGRGGVLLHHAWNLSLEDGSVVDVTIPDYLIDQERREYLGVRFSARRAHDATWHNDASILDDPKHGWPILREPWVADEESPGETASVLEHMLELGIATRDVSDDLLPPRPAPAG